MSYILDGTTIRNPHGINENNSTQVAVQKPLSGSVRRQYFGSNKRIWTLTYVNAKKSEYDAIYTIYASYLSTGSTKVFSSTEANYTISATNVHIDLLQRNFSISGSSYISGFALVLTEA